MSERTEVQRKKFEIIFQCQSCDKDIPKEEQKDSLAYYFAKEFDEYYCIKCAQERHDYLVARYT
mgnify:CR=1 FL=1